MPANGESVTITTVASVPVDVSLNLLKRDSAATGSKKVMQHYRIAFRCFNCCYGTCFTALCIAHL